MKVYLKHSAAWIIDIVIGSRAIEHVMRTREGFDYPFVPKAALRVEAGANSKNLKIATASLNASHGANECGTVFVENLLERLRGSDVLHFVDAIAKDPDNAIIDRTLEALCSTDEHGIPPPATQLRIIPIDTDARSRDVVLALVGIAEANALELTGIGDHVLAHFVSTPSQPAHHEGTLCAVLALPTSNFSGRTACDGLSGQASWTPIVPEAGTNSGGQHRTHHALYGGT